MSKPIPWTMLQSSAEVSCDNNAYRQVAQPTTGSRPVATTWNPSSSGTLISVWWITTVVQRAGASAKPRAHAGHRYRPRMPVASTSRADPDAIGRDTARTTGRCSRVVWQSSQIATFGQPGVVDWVSDAHRDAVGPNGPVRQPDNRTNLQELAANSFPCPNGYRSGRPKVLTHRGVL